MSPTNLKNEQESLILQSQPLVYHDGQEKLVGQLFLPAQLQEQTPAIIVFPAFEGLSDFALDYARLFSEQGYIVLVADIYGNAKTATTIEGCFELINPFLKDRALVRSRAEAAFAALSLQQHVDKSRIGAIGFCFGGQCLLELTRSGSSLKAGVSAHGMLAHSDLPTRTIHTHLLIIHGISDPQVPAEQVMEFSSEMTKAGAPDWQLILLSHAQHSFTDPRTGTFDPALECSMGRAYDRRAALRTHNYAQLFFKEELIDS